MRSIDNALSVGASGGGPRHKDMQEHCSSLGWHVPACPPPPSQWRWHVPCIVHSLGMLVHLLGFPEVVSHGTGIHLGNSDHEFRLCASKHYHMLHEPGMHKDMP